MPFGNCAFAGTGILGVGFTQAARSDQRYSVVQLAAIIGWTIGDRAHEQLPQIADIMSHPLLDVWHLAPQSQGFFAR
jgi:hypothetical protein